MLTSSPIEPDEASKFHTITIDLVLSYPKSQKRARWSQNELAVVLNEIPQYFLKGFVEKGQLTTRYEVSVGLLDMILQLLKVGLTGNTTFHNTCPSEDDIEYTIKPVYEIVRMPISTEDIKKDVTDVLKKYKYEAAKHEKFMKKVYQHLPERINMMLKLNNPRIRELFENGKPYIRIIGLERKESGNEENFVFVHEVVMAINRLRGIDIEKARTDVFPYFPVEYLNFVLSEYNSTIEDITLVNAPVSARNEYTSCIFSGPTGENVLPAISAFFRFISSMNKVIGDKEKLMELITFYDSVLITDQVLPYCTKFCSELQRNHSTEKLMKSCLGWPATEKKKDSSVHYDVPHGVTDKVPKEIIQSFPSEHQYNAALVLKANPRFALLLHEQGYCKSFCFASLMKINKIGFPCKRTPEIWKNQILHCIKNNGKKIEFLPEKQLRSMCTNPVTFWEPSEGDEILQHPSETYKREKKTDKKPRAKRVPLPRPEFYQREANDDTKEMPPAYENEKPKTESTSCSSRRTFSITKSHPNGTENLEENDDDDDSESSTTANLSIIDQNEDHNTQYENMMAAVQREHLEKMKSLKKKMDIMEKKSVQDQTTISELRAENKQFKKTVETKDDEKKEMKMKLGGDIKRITAEKNKMEDEFLKLKTEKAILQTDSLKDERKKIEQKMEKDYKKMSDEFSNVIKTKDAEMEELRQELGNMRSRMQTLIEENQELKDENQELKKRNLEEKENQNNHESLDLRNDIRLHQTVLGLRIQIIEMESKVKLYEAKEKFTDDKIADMKQQFTKMETEKNEVEEKLKEMEELRSKANFAMELKQIYEDHAAGSTKSSVQRIEDLTRALETARKDEKNYSYAKKRFMAYKELEHEMNAVREAHEHLDIACRAKKQYQIEIESLIARIKAGIPLYFFQEGVSVNPPMYPPPFTVETEERMHQMGYELEKKMEEHQWLGDRAPKYKSNLPGWF
ncbi:Protein CBG25319 [Caenorhabditis briggsae]|uniref:Protein CBG25319 n=1 Tax=Caenorhabditis briggsae TaxID=6238 RepID=B6IH17_CAEBR|nr:Protein CBG25319 [Caenorhabditis briggsae]CAR99197.1 Protein CBG25319 [Caenorhabditis briggsae]